VSYFTAESFCEKHLFREFLKKNSFNAPLSMGISEHTDDTALDDVRVPAIVWS